MIFLIRQDQGQEARTYIPVKEASKLVGYSQQYLRRLLRQEKLGGIKVGQVWLVDKGDLDVYLEQAQNVTDQRFGLK